MCDKITDCLEELGEEIVISKRELGLGLLCCLLMGIIIGAIFSPKKRVMIGNNNGNNNKGSLDCDDECNCSKSNE